ncbi:MAG: hypothetical protein HOP33_18865 [Verrucomicrobia bacterium]|nr:hypothetical protein [Verrucomicrobiota bacterium]
MSSKFVPLLPTAPASAGPGRTVDSAVASSAFMALASSAAPSPAGTCSHAPAQSSVKPSVTLRRDGDRVTHVRVECACGQVIELECAY